jgi:hypothetical protein
VLCVRCCSVQVAVTAGCSLIDTTIDAQSLTFSAANLYCEVSGAVSLNSTTGITNSGTIHVLPTSPTTPHNATHLQVWSAFTQTGSGVLRFAGGAGSSVWFGASSGVVVGGAVSMSDALQAVEFAGEDNGGGTIASISAAFSGALRCFVVRRVCSSLRLSSASCFLFHCCDGEGLGQLRFSGSGLFPVSSTAFPSQLVIGPGFAVVTCTGSGALSFTAVVQMPATEWVLPDGVTHSIGEYNFTTGSKVRRLSLSVACCHLLVF